MKCKNCKNLYNLSNEKDVVVGRWCPKINDDPDMELERECSHYKAMTNADMIRSMTDEELAEWLHNIAQFEDDEQEPMVSIYDLDNECETDIHDSYGDLLNWLQKEKDGR